MGQRSQIFIRYEKDNQKQLIARYYQWNYGERMISRARYGIEWLKKNYEYLWFNKDKIPRIFDTNFDMIDCVISSDIFEEYKRDIYFNKKYNINEYLFELQDNNDGKLFVDISADGTIKYALLDCSNKKIMSCSEYMRWDISKDWNTPRNSSEEEIINICVNNIRTITKMAKKMTKEEVEEFIKYDYSYIVDNV